MSVWVVRVCRWMQVWYECVGGESVGVVRVCSWMQVVSVGGECMGGRVGW